MKFQALISNSAAMREFMTIVTCLAKLSKICVMRMTPHKVYFILSEEEKGPREPLAWCELSVSFYFQEYVLIGVSESYNEIYLELPIGLLARSLALLKQDVESFKIKLTNKESPCLTLKMEMSSGNIQSRQCIHDIPVELISRIHWSDYEEPSFTDFHVTIEMPKLKILKTIVERMKTLSQTITVSAAKSGILTLQIRTNLVTLGAHFGDLSVESFAVEESSQSVNSEQDEKVYTIVDIKKFLMFMSGLQLNNCRTMLSIIQGKMVKLFLEQPGAMSLQVFLTQLTL